MHEEIMNFCKGVRLLSPAHFKNTKVLEIGSVIVNGSVRQLFENCEYTGIDVAPGEGVDKVCVAHEFPEPDNSFDTIISTQALEHDMYYQHTLRKAVKLLKSGGLLIISCATGSSWEHGTPQHGPDDSLTATLQGAWSTYYRNISSEDLCTALGDPDLIFEEWNVRTQTNSAGGQDLLCYGIKKRG